MDQALLLKDSHHAAREAEALLEKTEVIAYAHAPDHSLYQRQLAAARERLDEAAWEAAWGEGRAMMSEQAVTYALKKGEASPTQAVSGKNSCKV